MEDVLLIYLNKLSVFLLKDKLTLAFCKKLQHWPELGKLHRKIIFCVNSWQFYPRRKEIFTCAASDANDKFHVWHAKILLNSLPGQNLTKFIWWTQKSLMHFTMATSNSIFCHLKSFGKLNGFMQINGSIKSHFSKSRNGEDCDHFDGGLEISDTKEVQ